MKKPLHDFGRSIPRLLTYLANRLSITGSSSYFSTYGIGIMEFRVMSTMATETEQRAMRIANIIGLNKSAVSRTLKTLQGQGLIISSTPPGSGRPVFRLSPEGQRVYAGARKIADDRQILLLDGLKKSERDELIRLLQVLLGNVEKLDALARDLKAKPVDGGKGKKPAPKRVAANRTGRGGSGER